LLHCFNDAEATWKARIVIGLSDVIRKQFSPTEWSARRPGRSVMLTSERYMPEQLACTVFDLELTGNED